MNLGPWYRINGVMVYVCVCVVVAVGRNKVNRKILSEE